jgi:hypothetical protein
MVDLGWIVDPLALIKLITARLGQDNALCLGPLAVPLMDGTAFIPRLLLPF